MAVYQEQIFFFYILENPIYLNTTKPEFFTNQMLKDMFEIAKEYTLKYHTGPSKEQMWELVRIKGLSDKISEDIVSALYNVKGMMQNYDDKWVEDNVGPWIQLRNLDNVMRKSIAFMKTTQVTSENASEVVEKVRSMMTSETALDFGFDLGSDFFDAASHRQTRLARTSTGYDYFDICMKGGYWKGSLTVLLGPPKGGKSLWLCNLAARSVSLGHNTAYITLELQEEIVNSRIGSNMLNIEMDDYEKISEDQDLLKKMLNNLKNDSFKPMGELHVKEFPSSTASVNDIETYLLKAQEILGFKFNNIFIDYINIMKNWRNPNTENTYMKIKQIAEDLRAMGMRNSWAIISATQVSRSGWESSDVNITNISESAALLFTVDLLFGIIINAEMKARNEYYIKCLANRVNGYENTKKKFLTDWKYARIEEDKNSQIEDMDFMINSFVNHNARRRADNGQNILPQAQNLHNLVDNINFTGSVEFG